MNISIVYCVMWNYKPHATRVAAEIQEQYPQATIQLVKGSNGIFDVHLNDELLYNKSKERGNFPPKGEIVQRIRQQIQ